MPENLSAVYRQFEVSYNSKTMQFFQHENFFQTEYILMFL